MEDLRHSNGQRYLTTGQAAKALRISVSTLKRWIQEEAALDTITRNSSGWKLFSKSDMMALQNYQKWRRKIGKTFKSSTLEPANLK